MTNKQIYCFKGNQNDSDCTSIIDLDTLESVQCSNGFNEDDNFIIEIKSKTETFSFKAKDSYEKNEWTLKIKMVLESIKYNTIDEYEEIEEQNRQRLAKVF
jgi:hypothetical protein